MIKTEKRVINGREWQCTQWSGTKNLTMFHAVATLLAPAIAHGVVPGNNLLNANVNIAGAVDTLIAGLGTSQKTAALIHDLMSNVHIDGRHITPAEFDIAFTGPALFDLLPGLLFVVETNFGDFSKLVGGIMSRFADQNEPAPEPISPAA